MRGRVLVLLACFVALAALVRAQGDASAPIVAGSTASHHVVVRLRPGQDLRQELWRVVEAQGLEAACVVTCVGSLTKVALRFADQKEPTTLEGKFEVVSLVGTLEKGGGHLHLSVSDGQGRTLGGHLAEGSAVYTTAEVVLLALDDVRFRREPDPVTTYRELVVEPRR